MIDLLSLMKELGTRPNEAPVQAEEILALYEHHQDFQLIQRMVLGQDLSDIPEEVRESIGDFQKRNKPYSTQEIIESFLPRVPKDQWAFLLSILPGEINSQVAAFLKTLEELR
jgi:hypothetical protein